MKLGPILLVLFAIPAAALALPPPRYLPLEAGNRWTYVVTDGLHMGTKKQMSVIGMEGELFRLSFQGKEFRVGGTPDALDIELPGEGLVPWYRFQEASWVHRDLPGFTCADRSTYRFAGFEDVTTPSGTYRSCLRLDISASCDDGGRGAEWWAPEVGLVRWVEITLLGGITYSLQSFEHLPRFIRGDANTDGAGDISDAITILDYLFLGAEKVTCEKAADTNDDGALDLSDAVALLGYLYLGERAPGEPLESCGHDPTPDELTCESFGGCR